MRATRLRPLGAVASSAWVSTRIDPGRVGRDPGHRRPASDVDAGRGREIEEHRIEPRPVEADRRRRPRAVVAVGQRERRTAGGVSTRIAGVGRATVAEHGRGQAERRQRDDRRRRAEHAAGVPVVRGLRARAASTARARPRARSQAATAAPAGPPPTTTIARAIPARSRRRAGDGRDRVADGRTPARRPDRAKPGLDQQRSELRPVYARRTESGASWRVNRFRVKRWLISHAPDPVQPARTRSLTTTRARRPAPCSRRNATASGGSRWWRTIDEWTTSKLSSGIGSARPSPTREVEAGLAIEARAARRPRRRISGRLSTAVIRTRRPPPPSASRATGMSAAPVPTSSRSRSGRPRDERREGAPAEVDPAEQPVDPAQVAQVGRQRGVVVERSVEQLRCARRGGPSGGPVRRAAQGYNADTRSSPSRGHDRAGGGPVP